MQPWAVHEMGLIDEGKSSQNIVARTETDEAAIICFRRQNRHCMQV